MLLHLLRRLHQQRIIEAIEVVKQPDSGNQLHDLTFIVVPAQLVPELVIHGMSVAGDALGQTQSYFVLVREIATLLKVGQVFDLLVAPAVPSRLDGMRGQSILAPVDLAGSDEQQFLKLGGNGACFHDSTEVRNHGLEQFRAMCDRAEHVGDVAANFHEMVVDGGHFRRDLRFVKT